MSLLLLAQDTYAQSASPGTADSESFDALWAFLGNGGWMLAPIALCLGATIFVIMSARTRTSRDRIGPAGHEQTIKALLRQNDLTAADTFCRENPSSLTKVARVGIGLISEGQQAVADGLAIELAAERLRLHTRFSHLRALGICTPLLGVLGSLTGLINALVQYNSAAPNSGRLAQAIGESLTPSAAGLLVGIIAMAAFFILRERASAAMLRIQDVVNSAFRRVVYATANGRTSPQPE